MDEDFPLKESFFIDKNPSMVDNTDIKTEINASVKADCYKKRKHRYSDNPPSYFPGKETEQSYEITKRRKEDLVNHESVIKAATGYYENVLKDLKKGVSLEMKDDFICNTLEESDGKEVELACYSLVSHCLEMLLSNCKETSIISRFMTAFSKDKITVCTSANASHLTEILIYHAVKSLKNWYIVLNSNDDKEEVFVSYCMNWLIEFGNFMLENLDDCLHSQYSSHVLCTLIGALAGDLAGNKELMSRNLKNHKKVFHSQLTEMNTFMKDQNPSPVILEQIPKAFSDVLKNLYKKLVNSENLTDFINNSHSGTVIEALLFALRKRHPKSCNKMITKLAKRMFLEKNDDVPLCLLDKSTSFVFDEMFKAANEDVQLKLWNEYVADHIKQLVIDPIGNFVIQRIYDAISNRTLFEIACKCTWCTFNEVFESQNYGIFVSISTACNRFGAQQAFFMENIMMCLQCYEPIERQDLLIPLLLGFERYDKYILKKSLKVCLQGSLVVQAILKFHKPMKAIKSILSMLPEEIEFLSGHIQGCHVLNAYFGSVTVGDKNKEKLLLHLQPVLVSMACDRNKSLTLSRIWTCLSLKLKEIIARQLVQHQQTLRGTKSGYAIFQKFGIFRFRKLEEWKSMQSNISSKRPQH